MNIFFEEHATAQRAGGIESATCGLIASLAKEGVVVTRSFTNAEPAAGIVPDCVHLHGIWSPTLAWRFVAWRRRGIPCVVTLHGMLEPWALAHKAPKKKVAWNLYQKRLLNMASALHATSEREAANLRKLGLKPPIAMIPWGIEVEEREVWEKETGDRKQETGNVDGKAGLADLSISASQFSACPQRTALFVGRIYPVKGLPMLVEAWARIRPTGWKMKIVGPDEAGHLAEVEALIHQAGLDGMFEFAGPLSGTALKQAYNGADLYIQPSHTENFGMAIAEAMARGLPVITTQGAPWRLLGEEHCGWWSPISTDGIAAALGDATRRSPEDLAAMGERGRAIVAERFAWEAIARQFVECYQWLRGEGPKSACVVG